MKKQIANISVLLFSSLFCIFCSELVFRKLLNFSQGTVPKFYRRDDIVSGLNIGNFNTAVRQRKNTGDFDVFIEFFLIFVDVF